MTEFALALKWILIAGLAFFAAFTLFFVWVYFTYRHYIFRIFETKPLFFPPAALPHPEAEDVEFSTVDGRRLHGSYLRHTSAKRAGVLLFCHEYSATRWLCDPYLGPLRADGFDVFAFDFCNHGRSEAIPGYEPLQWVTEYEVEDVLAAIRTLRGRSDAPAEGIGVFGVSKGGGAAIAAAARDPWVRAVATDGAFPVHETVTHYELRWVGIYVSRSSYKLWPRCFYSALTHLAVRAMAKKNHVRYVRLEREIARLRGRPLLMIHGRKDNYIVPEIVERFFAFARPPKELWLVAGAKHNSCIEVAADEYHDRLLKFFSNGVAG